MLLTVTVICVAPRTGRLKVYHKTTVSLFSSVRIKHVANCARQLVVKSRLVLPFWYRLTQVVLEKRPLNGCSCSCIW